MEEGAGFVSVQVQRSVNPGTNIFFFSTTINDITANGIRLQSHSVCKYNIICHFMTSEISIALDDASQAESIMHVCMYACMHVVCGIDINVSFHKCPSLVCM